VINLLDEALQRIEIAERLGIGIASVYRALADAEENSRQQKEGGVIREASKDSDCRDGVG
jgi:hypothetical protein